MIWSHAQIVFFFRDSHLEEPKLLLLVDCTNITEILAQTFFLHSTAVTVTTKTVI